VDGARLVAHPYADENAGLARTEAVSIQGYAHKHIGDLVDCLVDWYITRGTRVVVWSEPFPEKPVMQAIAFVYWLVREHHAEMGMQPKAIIRRAQTALGVDVDGVAGKITLTKAGFAVD
jgi:hypothetical protein